MVLFTRKEKKMLRFVYVEDEKYFQKEVKTIIIQHYIEKQMAVEHPDI